MSAEPDVPVGLIDTRELAFWVVVDRDGIADLHANGVPYRLVAEWLRSMADNADRHADENGEDV